VQFDTETHFVHLPDQILIPSGRRGKPVKGIRYCV